MLEDCLIAFGSNLGDSDGLYRELNKILSLDSRFRSTEFSSLISTEPVGSSEGQNRYRNGCIRTCFSGSTSDLFRVILKLEQTFGRVRHERWGARTIDLDLLLFGNHILQTDSLQIPHPRMTFRRFVLVPAAEVGEDLVHPLSLQSVGQHLQLLDDRPDRIALVVDDGALECDVEIRQKMLDYESRGWSIDPISTTDEIVKKAHRIKLLVYRQGLPEPLFSASRHFAGATLFWDGEVVERWNELDAAIEAMRQFP